MTPPYAARARDIAYQMTEPSESVTATADLLEQHAEQGRFR